MKTITFGLECSANKQCNIHVFKKKYNNLEEFSFYKQKKCVLCCDNFKGDVLILPCKHIFDLRCFMTYAKFNYLEKKIKDVKCPICKLESNTLDVFKKYKMILDIRLLIIKKCKTVNHIYYHKETDPKENNTHFAIPR
jgi:hypothetical protein